MTIELSEYVIDAIADAIVKKMQVPTEEEKALLQKWHDNRGISMKDFEDAMDALEQEPCGDCISRSHFDERVRVAGGMVEYEVSDDFKDGVLTVLEMLKTEPSIQPKSKTDVLDKIRAEIETKYGHCDICEYFENYDYEENDISEYRPIGNIADILQIIDKYKAERSDKE